MEGEDDIASAENERYLELESMAPWLEEIDTEDNPFVSKDDAECKSPFWEWNNSFETTALKQNEMHCLQ